MHSFEARGTAFVSVTQQFHTGSSTGRLVLNVLLSFAQLERELTAERTRDKVAAARREGHWTGGRPVLGYAIHAGPRQNRLVVVPDEASRVRDAYRLNLELGSLLPTTQELARRGWINKAHAAPEGTARPGKPFARTSLHQMPILVREVVARVDRRPDGGRVSVPLHPTLIRSFAARAKR